MWKCKQCAETIEDNFDVCWKCGFAKNGMHGNSVALEDQLLPNGMLMSQVIAENSNANSKSEVAQVLMRRYKEAYISARWRIATGRVVKWLAAVVSLIFAVIGFSLAQTLGQNSIVISMAMVIFFGGGIFGSGVLIMGQGQSLLAVLDTAVNTSRHLSKSDVAEIFLN